MDTLTSALDYPMVIVTAAADGDRSGCLVGFPQCFIVDLGDVQHAHPLRQLGFQAVRDVEAGHPA